MIAMQVQRGRECGDEVCTICTICTVYVDVWRADGGGEEVLLVGAFLEAYNHHHAITLLISIHQSRSSCDIKETDTSYARHTVQEGRSYGVRAHHLLLGASILECWCVAIWSYRSDRTARVKLTQFREKETIQTWLGTGTVTWKGIRRWLGFVSAGCACIVLFGDYKKKHAAAIPTLPTPPTSFIGSQSSVSIPTGGWRCVHSASVFRFRWLVVGGLVCTKLLLWAIRCAATLGVWNNNYPSNPSTIVQY